ncbi:protein translocase subunit SecF [Candidatus Uhrbacteria bacterium]|nr:protein translocase subunit SecF [Candidatus Uhrbacteria bacterium]MBD3284321.1 protein translocase subunit SecF [Candidatus Uhrbacteria bacterium]
MTMGIVKLRRLWYIISAVLVTGAIFVTAIDGLNFGIDFTGGSLLSVRFEERPTSVEIERALDGVDVGSMIIQPVGKTDVNIRMKVLDETTHQSVVSKLDEQFEGVTELRFDAIGPAIGAELRNKSLWALGVAFLAILAYIAYAFRRVSAPIKNWKYGVVTILAAIHDVLIPIGVFSILGMTMGMEVDTTFVVAILTVLGYSINDTIVVLDRVRENLHKISGSFEEIVNISLKQTIVRSLNTSVTTLFALVAVYLFGGDSLQPFALALIIGIIAGTYSSIFIASPLLVTWEKLGRK